MRVLALPGAGRHTLRVEGELSGQEAAALEPALLAAERTLPPGALVLDLDELELVDGVATALAVTAVRRLLACRGALVVLAPPQMLAHTLYRVGALEDGRLRVEHTRSEEPTTAN